MPFIFIATTLIIQYIHIIKMSKYTKPDQYNYIIHSVLFLDVCYYYLVYIWYFGDLKKAYYKTINNVVHKNWRLLYNNSVLCIFWSYSCFKRVLKCEQFELIKWRNLAVEALPIIGPAFSWYCTHYPQIIYYAPPPP